MDKVIPILPCPNMAAQIEFFLALGFQLVGEYTQPNSYAVVEHGEIKLHFWVNKKLIPAENPTMCIIQVGDVHRLCELFTNGLKEHYGKIPRSGAPKITKVRELKEDTRFTLTDTGGNTFYICTPRSNHDGICLRTLSNENYAKDFATLYDLMYSKESPETAIRFLPKLMACIHELDDLDKAKLLLIAYDIHAETNQPFDDGALKLLLEANRGSGGEWIDLHCKYKSLKEVSI